MKRFPPYLRVALLTTLLAVLLVGNISPVIPRASATATTCGSWQVVPSPHLPQIGELTGAAASSHTDVWATGAAAYSSPTGEPINSGVIEHWNGTRWSVVASPNRAVFSNALVSVTALSPNNVWAVGGSAGFKGSVYAMTLIEHWDGTSWSIVKSLNAAYDNGLTAITALAPDDLWAVGVSAPKFGGSQTLTEHWNGSTWSVVQSPNAIGANEFRSVAGAASNDVWAVGDYSYGGETLTLIEHWNGSAWSVVASPNPSGGDNVLTGAAAVTTNNVWAVGDSVGGHGLILH